MTSFYDQRGGLSCDDGMVLHAPPLGGPAPPKILKAPLEVFMGGLFWHWKVQIFKKKSPAAGYYSIFREQYG